MKSAQPAVINDLRSSHWIVRLISSGASQENVFGQEDVFGKQTVLCFFAVSPVKLLLLHSFYSILPPTLTSAWQRKRALLER